MGVIGSAFGIELEWAPRTPVLTHNQPTQSTSMDHTHILQIDPPLPYPYQYTGFNIHTFLPPPTPQYTTHLHTKLPQRVRSHAMPPPPPRVPIKSLPISINSTHNSNNPSTHPKNTIHPTKTHTLQPNRRGTAPTHPTYPHEHSITNASTSTHTLRAQKINNH